jgi:hypothetical protein
MRATPALGVALRPTRHRRVRPWTLCRLAGAARRHQHGLWLAALVLAPVVALF